jgi:hypothetical protein
MDMHGDNKAEVGVAGALIPVHAPSTRACGAAGRPRVGDSWTDGLSNRRSGIRADPRPVMLPLHRVTKETCARNCPILLRVRRGLLRECLNPTRALGPIIVATDRVRARIALSG